MGGRRTSCWARFYGIRTSDPIDFDHFAIPFDRAFDLVICNHMSPTTRESAILGDNSRRAQATFSAWPFLWSPASESESEPLVPQNGQRKPDASPSRQKDGFSTLYRAVGPDELADIEKWDQLRNVGGRTVKYFTDTGEQAASYAKQAVKRFGDPPYPPLATALTA